MHIAHDTKTNCTMHISGWNATPNIHIHAPHMVTSKKSAMNKFENARFGLERNELSLAASNVQRYNVKSTRFDETMYGFFRIRFVAIA